MSHLTDTMLPAFGRIAVGSTFILYACSSVSAGDRAMTQSPLLESACPCPDQQQPASVLAVSPRPRHVRRHYDARR